MDYLRRQIFNMAVNFMQVEEYVESELSEPELTEHNEYIDCVTAKYSSKIMPRIAGFRSCNLRQ